jgi:hypothetical protein
MREERKHETGSSGYECWFGPDGRVVAMAWTNPDGSTGREEYSYDEYGDMIEPYRERQIIRNPDGSRREPLKPAPITRTTKRATCSTGERT